MDAIWLKAQGFRTRWMTWRAVSARTYRAAPTGSDRAERQGGGDEGAGARGVDGRRGARGSEQVRRALGPAQMLLATS